MNQLIPSGGAAATMTSREIAELVESCPDSVKRSIERLMQSGVIASTPLVDFKNANGVTGQEYHVCKRDSYVIVAQLSPEFTARLVDRWQALEARMLAPAALSRLELLELAMQSGALRLAVANPSPDPRLAH